MTFGSYEYYIMIKCCILPNLLVGEASHEMSIKACFNMKYMEKALSHIYRGEETGVQWP